MTTFTVVFPLFSLCKNFVIQLFWLLCKDVTKPFLECGLGPAMSTSCGSLLEMLSQVSLQTCWIRICILTRSSDDSCSFILKFEKHTLGLKTLEFFCGVISACRALAPTPTIPSAWVLFYNVIINYFLLGFSFCAFVQRNQNTATALLSSILQTCVFDILSELSVLIKMGTLTVIK